MTDASDAREVGDGQPVDADAVRDAVLATHGDLVATVLSVADAVKDGSGEPHTDGQALATALERSLDDAGVHGRLPAVLATAVDAAGLSLAADPVAAPPYVTTTSRGPVLRGPTTDGRLVVTVRAFSVERDPRRYVRTTSDPASALDVEFVD